MTWRWAPQTRYTLRRTTASTGIIKGFWFGLVWLSSVHELLFPFTSTVRKLLYSISRTNVSVESFGNFSKRCKGPSIKDVRSQGGRGLSSADISRTRGIFQMQMSALFGAKNFRFFEIYGVSARTRGWRLSQCGHFEDRG